MNRSISCLLFIISILGLIPNAFADISVYNNCMDNVNIWLGFATDPFICHQITNAQNFNKGQTVNFTGLDCDSYYIYGMGVVPQVSNGAFITIVPSGQACMCENCPGGAGGIQAKPTPKQ